MRVKNLSFPNFGNDNGMFIPHICHFFYTGRILKTKFYTKKKQLKTPKTLKISLKKSNVCSFFPQSGKIYTWQKIFTHAPTVVPVTNMRYAWRITWERNTARLLWFPVTSVLRFLKMAKHWTATWIGRRIAGFFRKFESCLSNLLFFCFVGHFLFNNFIQEVTITSDLFLPIGFPAL